MENQVKTRLQHLIELRDTSQRKVISLEAEISLIERSLIIVNPTDEKRLALRESMRDAAKKEKEGHEKMVERLDEMIEAETKPKKKV